MNEWYAVLTTVFYIFLSIRISRPKNRELCKFKQISVLIGFYFNERFLNLCLNGIVE